MRFRLALVPLVLLLAAARAPAQGPDAVYVNWKGIDARTDLTAAEKAFLKSEFSKYLLDNFGPRIVLVDDPTKSVRKIALLNERSGRGHWGSWADGSDVAVVWVKEFLDTKAAEAFKTGGVWHIQKLACALAHTGAHELAHSYCANHPKRPGRTDKMKAFIEAEELGSTALAFTTQAQTAIASNLGKKPCPGDASLSLARVQFHGDDLTPPPGTPPEAIPFEADTFEASAFVAGGLAGYFELGWINAARTDPEREFAYKLSLWDVTADTSLTFFDQASANFTLHGVSGPYAGLFFEMERPAAQLSNWVTNTRGVQVARQAQLDWDVDGDTVTDVSVLLDTRLFPEWAATTNGFTLEPPVVPELPPICLAVLGLLPLGLKLRRRR